MRTIRKWLLVLLGVAALAAAAFTVYRKLGPQIRETLGSGNAEPTYEELTVSTLPVMYNVISGQQVGVLYGYVEEQNMVSVETPLIPINQSRLSIHATLYGNDLAAASYMVYRRGEETPMEQGEFRDWDRDSDTILCEAQLTNLLKNDRDYLVTIRLTLTTGKNVWYYCRIHDASTINAVAFVDYINTFHTDTFFSGSASKYSAKLEQDINADTQTLAEMHITGTVNQLSWDDMNPVEVEGTRTWTILQMDETFGSVKLQYELESGVSGERFLVDEYLSLRYSKQAFYLMDYYRTVVELLSANEVRFADGNLDLGVSPDGALHSIMAEGDPAAGTNTWYAFGKGGEIWCYCPVTKELKRAFSFRDTDDLHRSAYRAHDAKPIRVENDGSVTFLVYGYMNRGAHEGRVGVSCMRYDALTNHLSELFYLPYKGMVQTLEQSINTLSAMSSDGHVVVMVGDSVYMIDPEKQEMNLLTDKAGDRYLKVNRDQTVVAWMGQNEKGDRSLTNILYLDTGESQVLEAEPGQTIVPQGYIEDDCILGIRNKDETMEINGDLRNLYCGMIIRNRQGEDEIRYQYEDIRLSAINVLDDQIEMDRVQVLAAGEYQAIDSDTVMQNTGVENLGRVPVTQIISPDRMRVPIIEGIGLRGVKDEPEVSFASFDKIDYSAAENFVMEPAEQYNADLVYYAYAEGELRAVCETAGEAIRLAFPNMGSVIDSKGRMVWYRTTRSDRADPETRGRKKGTLEESLKLSIGMVAATAGVNLPDTSLTSDMTAMAMMNLAVPGRAINLTGAPLRALLYYLDRNCIMVVIDHDGLAMTLIGFDPWNVRYYDPVLGKTKLQGQNDGAQFLENGCTILGYLPMDTPFG